MQASAADSAARDAAPPGLPGRNTRERFGAFTVFSIGLLVLLVAYFMSIRLLEAALDREIQERVDQAIAVTDFDRPLIQQMKENLNSRASIPCLENTVTYANSGGQIAKSWSAEKTKYVLQRYDRLQSRKRKEEAMCV